MDSAAKADEETLVLGKYRMNSGKDGVLGQGSFSIVQQGMDMETGAEVAIKSYRLDKIRKESTQMEALLTKYTRQIQVLQHLAEPLREQNTNKRLCHPHFAKVQCDKLFLKLLDYSKDGYGLPGQSRDGTMYVVTEVADYSLKDYLETRRQNGIPIPLDCLKQLTSNFILCVAMLHAKGYAHLDLKPENLMRVNKIWKVIDVDGCVPLMKHVYLDDQTVSFSPCYCSPEWAQFLRGGGKSLLVRDTLDVWSVGISLCELIIFRAALRPKYSSYFRGAGSHRKASFLFLEWLANPNERLILDKRLAECDPAFMDLLFRHMLVKNYERRMTLAETLSHPFIKDTPLATLDHGGKAKASADNEIDKAAEIAIKKRRERVGEKQTDRPPMRKGLMFKLNVDGDPKNRDHWLKRDMWLSHNGSLCYFSQKKEQRLVLLDHSSLMRCTVRRLTAGRDSCQDFAFAIVPLGDASGSLARMEAQFYACENEEDCKSWIAQINKAIQMEPGIGNKIKMSMGLAEDFANFRIEVKNRREKVEDSKAFEPLYKCELWKLNQEGDMMNPEHWLKREMWIAKNGALCYFSKKENRALQYYKTADMRLITAAIIPAVNSAKPYTFTLTLPPHDGLEYAPGVFAAMNLADQDYFLHWAGKFKRRASVSAVKKPSNLKEDLLNKNDIENKNNIDVSITKAN